jgi:hypothetical protein
MLRITADVNGGIIGYIFIHNKSKRLKDASLYDAAVYTPDGEGVFGIEDVAHIRSRPWYELVERVARHLKE